jgi:hypothetical protein
MIDVSYEYGEAFQRRLLALLVRDPKSLSSIIQPQYFTHPLLVDIARIVTEAHEKHPDARVSEVYLREKVKASLRRNARQNWPLYKKEIILAFSLRISDESLLKEKAAEFAKEARYRQALVDAERFITVGRYDKVHTVIEEASKLASDQTKDGANAFNLPVYPFHQLLATEDEAEQDYLVETIVPSGGAVLSIGLPKGLKSWFSTAVALDASIGNCKALGYFDVPRSVRVLLVQVEDSLGRTKSRLHGLHEARPLRRNPYPGNLIIITRCPLNLTDPGWVAQLEAVIAKQKTELVIFDVFRRLFRGNVNSAEDTASFFEVVDALRDRYGMAVWVVHHSNKNVEAGMMTRALGSINLTGWAEVLLHFKDKQQSGSTATCKLEIETKDQVIDSELKVILDDEALPMLRVEKAKSAEDKLQKAMSELKDEWTVEDLAKTIDLKYGGAYKVLQDWRQEGIAVRVKKGSKGHRARYRFRQSAAE